MSEDLPPHNLDAERAVLGAVLVDQAHLTSLLSVGLRSQHFWQDRHKLVFDAMVTCDDAGVSIDPVTLADVIERQGLLGSVGGMEGIDGLSAYVPAAGHAREYGQIVRELAQRRALITASHMIREQAQRGKLPLIEIVGDAEKQIDEVVLDMPSGDLGPLPFADELDRAERVMSGQVEQGIPTGYKDLDAMIGGWQDEALIVLAARPAMGKSAIVTNMAEAALKGGFPVAVFSLEMSRSEILRRMLAVNANVHGDKLLRGPLSADQLKRIKEASAIIQKWPLHVDEGVDAGIYDIRSRARRLNSRLPFGLGLVIVDYLQLIRPENPNANRVTEIGAMTRGLKTLAKELGIPVLAISQLSRALELRSDKHPQLSDLRESGSIEQDADLVLFLHRPGYYDDEVDISETDLSVAKHRNGRLGSVDLMFLPEFPKFMSAATQTQVQTEASAQF